MNLSVLVESTWFFVVGYIGLVAGFLTALYFVMRYLIARRSRARDFDAALEMHTTEEVELDTRLQNLENRLEHLITLNTRLHERLKWMEGQMAAALTGGNTPGRRATTAEQVARGFEKGKTVSDLAEEFGRGKGEIELMLNLREIRRRRVEN